MPTNEMAPVAPVAAAIAKSSFESAADTQTAAWAIPSIATVLPDAVGDSSFVGIGRSRKSPTAWMQLAELIGPEVAL